MDTCISMDYNLLLSKKNKPYNLGKQHILSLRSFWCKVLIILFIPIVHLVYQQSLQEIIEVELDTRYIHLNQIRTQSKRKFRTSFTHILSAVLQFLQCRQQFQDLLNLKDLEDQGYITPKDFYILFRVSETFNYCPVIARLLYNRAGCFLVVALFLLK